MRNDSKRERCGRCIRENEAGLRIANAIIDNKSNKKVIRKGRSVWDGTGDWLYIEMQ